MKYWFLITLHNKFDFGKRKSVSDMAAQLDTTKENYDSTANEMQFKKTFFLFKNMSQYGQIKIPCYKKT